MAENLSQILSLVKDFETVTSVADFLRNINIENIDSTYEYLLFIFHYSELSIDPFSKRHSYARILKYNLTASKT